MKQKGCFVKFPVTASNVNGRSLFEIQYYFNPIKYAETNAAEALCVPK
jgi:hypothetical protein